MKRLFLPLCLGVLSLTCSVAFAADSQVIKIVSSLPRTGSANAQSTTLVNGIKIAIDEVGGKIGDFTLAYEDWDDASPERGQWDPAVEAENAQKAVKDPDIMAYIGTYNSGAAKISMPILNQASLVMVSPANTYPGLTKPHTGEANEPQVYRPSGKSISSVSSPPTISRAKSPRSGPRNSVSRKSSSSMTANSMARAWPTCSSAPAVSSASPSSVTKASTRRPRIIARS